MTLSTLPNLSCFIGFGATDFLEANQYPLPNSPDGDMAHYWTDVSVYVQAARTTSGKQHYLDRVETASLSLTLNNRDGYFWNIANPISIRIPVAITATYGSTIEPVFFGFIDAIEEVVIDQLNSELTVTCSDFLKYLSLRSMASEHFWPTYARPATNTTIHWYRLDTTPSATITYGIATSTTSVTYTAVNSFAVGQNVTISGLTAPSGASALNFNNVIITAASSTSFTVTVTGATSGTTSSGTGVAYLTSIPDQVSSLGGTLGGLVSFQTNGAMVYDTNTCVDLANGSANGSGWFSVNGATPNVGGIDFWILGSNTAGQSIMEFLNSSSYFELVVSSTGRVQVWNPSHSTGAALVAQSSQSLPVNDGYWHHVGLAIGPTGYIELYADGNFYPFASPFNTLTSIGPTSAYGGTFHIGRYGSNGSLAALLDEVVISNTSVTQYDLLNRWCAGTLLQIGAPATLSPLPGTSSNNVKSGDRIAEILTLAGFGVIIYGEVNLSSNVLYINESSTSWSIGAAGNGYTYVEPYYWDSPVTTSTALDLILQITDTDIGVFFQKPDGTFQFHNQNFYGTWSWNASNSTGTWAPHTYTPTGSHVWTDSGTGTPYSGPQTRVIYDDADLWTLVKITPQSGTAQVYENTAAEPRYGISVLEKSSTVHTSLTLALSTATFLGHIFRTPPLARLSSVELHAESGNGAYNSSMFECKIGDVVSFSRHMPAQTTPIVQQYVVESVNHDFRADPGQWHTTFILDPYPVRPN